MGFMDRDFLLSTQTAGTLFHDTAEKCPIIDYHCHLSPREIWEDVRYDNLTQVWLGGDHYKWRLMRAAGVEEKYITGDADDREKFLRFARVLGRAVGHPLYHWSHLELQRYFGWEGILHEGTAPEVWELTGKMLREPGFSSRQLILRSRVEILCTTDDPADDLIWHQMLAGDASFPVTVLPAWRPDRAMSPEKTDYPAYLDRLGDAAGIRIRSLEDLKDALTRRMDVFASRGCVLSDHGLGILTEECASPEEAQAVLTARLEGRIPSPGEAAAFRGTLLRFLAGEYHRRDWVMQLHYGVRRDNNPISFRALGPDTGFDCVDDGTSSARTAAFLGALEEAGTLPRTILYSLSPNDNAAIDTVIGCFQNAEAVGRLQHGAAWWFNDHLDGITAHLRSLAAQGYLPGFIGMLTDSRSFLSYPRHEYFRRILCRQLGEWVEEGLFPRDEDTLKGIVEDICYRNARRYFRFPEKERKGWT